MTKKVLLLNPPSKNLEIIIRDNLYGCFIKGKASYMWPPMNLAQIAGVLEDKGVECKIIDAMAERLGPVQTLKRVQRFKPDFIIIISATSTFDYDAEYVESIKEKVKGLKSIYVGTHMITESDDVLKRKAVDFIIMGEPELVIRDLVKAYPDMEQVEKVKGLKYRYKNKTVFTGHAPPINDLDELPFPARHLISNIDYFNPLAKQLPYTTITSSRGCPFSCTYCVANLIEGKRFRAKSARQVVDEIEHCYKELGIKEFFFRDETFTIDKKRVISICDEILKRKLNKISWICASRVDTIDKEMMITMKKAGCHLIKFGVESGNQEILDNIKKGIKVDQTRKVFRWINEIGIDSVAHFMIGCPGDTEKTIKETIRFSKEIKPTFASFNVTTPYPGTTLWEQVSDKLKIKNFSIYDIEKIHEEATFNSAFCDLSKKEIERFYSRAYLSFYARPGYIMKMLLKQSSLKELMRSIRAGYYVFAYTLKYKFSRIY